MSSDNKCFPFIHGAPSLKAKQVNLDLLQKRAGLVGDTHTFPVVPACDSTMTPPRPHFPRGPTPLLEKPKKSSRANGFRRGAVRDVKN